MLMVRGLREAGARVSVLAPVLNGDELASGLAVPHPQPEPDLEAVDAALPISVKLKNFFRRWLLYPDADIRWCRRAAKAAIQHWPDGFDWVITSSPPESLHVAGRMLQRHWSCAWHADIRDFWFQYPLVPVRRYAFRRWLERPFAKSLLAKADIVTAVSQPMAEEAAKISGRAASVIKNFVDPPPARDANFFDGYPDKSFTKDMIHVVYTGAFSLSDPNRHLAPVLDVFKKAAVENPDLILHLAGPLTTTEQRLIDTKSLEDRVFYHGRVDAATARQFQVNAHALILTAAEGTCVVPGKFAEYKAAGVPIIAIGSGPWRQGLGRERDAKEQLIALTREREGLAQSDIYAPQAAARAVLALMADAPANGKI